MPCASTLQNRQRSGSHRTRVGPGSVARSVASLEGEADAVLGTIPDPCTAQGGDSRGITGGMCARGCSRVPHTPPLCHVFAALDPRGCTLATWGPHLAAYPCGDSWSVSTEWMRNEVNLGRRRVFYPSAYLLSLGRGFASPFAFPTVNAANSASKTKHSTEWSLRGRLSRRPRVSGVRSLQRPVHPDDPSHVAPKSKGQPPPSSQHS